MWGAVSERKRWKESEMTKVFLGWFRFGTLMKAEYRATDLPGNERKEYWVGTVSLVEKMLVNTAQKVARESQLIP